MLETKKKNGPAVLQFFSHGRGIDVCAELSQICFALNLLAVPPTRLMRLKQSPEQKRKNPLQVVGAGTRRVGRLLFAYLCRHWRLFNIASPPFFSILVTNGPFAPSPHFFWKPLPPPNPVLPCSSLATLLPTSSPITSLWLSVTLHSSSPVSPFPPPASVPSRFPPSAAADCGHAARSFRFVWGRLRLNMDSKKSFGKLGGITL